MCIRDRGMIDGAIGTSRRTWNTLRAVSYTHLDVGVNVDENGNMCGDVDFEAVEPIVANITPVPGGTGAVTTSVLAKHVVKAAEALSRL